MKTLLTAISTGLLIMGLLVGPADAASSNQGAFGKSLSGTVQSIDGLNVTLMTESGQAQSYPITQESVLAGITKGDQVWFELNEEGKVTNMAKADGKVSPDDKDSNPQTTPPTKDQPRKGEIAG